MQGRATGLCAPGAPGCSVAAGPPPRAPRAPGSQRPTCGPALARNTCAQQLPRTEELFEAPYPVWELFQMKSVTLPCIKTFFFFLRRKKRKKESSKESPFRAVGAQPSPCPVAGPHPCLLPPLRPSRLEGGRSVGSCLPAGALSLLLLGQLSLLFFIRHLFVESIMCVHCAGPWDSQRPGPPRMC